MCCKVINLFALDEGILVAFRLLPVDEKNWRHSFISKCLLNEEIKSILSAVGGLYSAILQTGSPTCTSVLPHALLHNTVLALCQVDGSSIILIHRAKGWEYMLRLRVKEEAQARGFTIARLERTAGIDIKTVRAIWHNPRHNASFETLEKIAAAIGVSVTNLIEDDSDVRNLPLASQMGSLEEVLERLRELDRLAYSVKRGSGRQSAAEEPSRYKSGTDSEDGELERAKRKFQALLPNGLKVVYVQERHAHGIFAVDSATSPNS